MKHLAFAFVLVWLAVAELFANAAENSLRGSVTEENRDLKGATKKREEEPKRKEPRRHHIKPKQTKQPPRRPRQRPQKDFTRRPSPRPKQRAPKQEKPKLVRRPPLKHRPERRNPPKRKVPKTRPPKIQKDKGPDAEKRKGPKTKYLQPKNDIIDEHQQKGEERRRGDYSDNKEGRPTVYSHDPYSGVRKAPKVKYSKPEYYTINDNWQEDESSWQDEYSADDENNIHPAAYITTEATVPSKNTRHYYIANAIEDDPEHASSDGKATKLIISPTSSPVTSSSSQSKTEASVSSFASNSTKLKVSPTKHQGTAWSLTTKPTTDGVKAMLPTTILSNGSNANDGQKFEDTPPISISSDGNNDYSGKLLIGATIVILFGGASLLGLVYYRQNRLKKDSTDRVSTMTSSITHAGSSEPTGDATAATVDYDYPRYLSGAASPSVSDVGATLGSQTRQALPSCDNTLYSGNPTIFSDQEYPDVQEELLDIYAPAGKLGVVIDTPDEGAPAVHAIKSTSPVVNKIQVGDKIVALDDEDTRALTAIEVSKLISGKINQASRKLTIIRQFPGHVMMESI